VVLAEMLLIGGVIYAILRFLQGTRGARLMRAVGMIVLVSFLIVRLVAQKFEFDRINYLYSYFLWGVFLVALVVFQPELRRGLIRLGELWGIGSSNKDAQLIVEPVTTAVVRLSRKKIGAILALERVVPIGGFVESGVRLDAQLTPELLESLFWPGSALHDMGVIIQRGRVAAAGCQFPLADSQEVDRALGSRHRAALGLSQECDALVIVVSEETGAISVAERGQLIRGLTSEELLTHLTRALAVKSKPSDPQAEPVMDSIEPLADVESARAPRPGKPVDLVGARERE
jgi:diadenylate cyclase